MRNISTEPRRRQRLTAALALATAAGLALGVAASAGANSAGKGRGVLFDVFQLIPPEGLSFTTGVLMENEAAPSAIPVKATIGEVSPPAPDQPVLGSFDAIRQCADINVETELAAAAFAKLAEEPRLIGLERFWDAFGLEPKAVALGAAVPPLLLDRLPPSLSSDEMDVARKKRAFILMMLPHVLKANDEILRDRERVAKIRDLMDAELASEPGDEDVAWLFDQFDLYDIEDFDYDHLLVRMDVIPPALAIAQAAKESGWGGSRFAQAGNAMYGQWTWDPEDKGMVPRNRPAGKTYRVRAFDSILDATRAYAVNINTHPAYGRLREIRRQLRDKGRTPTGVEFAETLEKYATIGDRYVRAVKHIIQSNGLVKLNDASLAPTIALPEPQPIPAMADKLEEEKFDSGEAS